jgi:hypothetical protein
MSTTLTDPEGSSLVARIHTRKRLTEDLAAADDVHTAAVQAAVAGHGPWRDVQQAGEVVRQCRAALRACGEER